MKRYLNGVLVDATAADRAQRALDDETWIAEAGARRIAQIDVRLAAIDAEGTRPARAVAAGTAVVADTDRLAALEAEAAALRVERAGLVA